MARFRVGLLSPVFRARALSRLALIAVASLLAASSAAQSRPRITGIAHLSVYARDLQRASTFYKQFLGLNEPFGVATGGYLAGTRFQINDRQYVEVMPEREPGSDRLNHVAFETDDVEGLLRALKARGVAVPATLGWSRVGERSFTINDPDGHVLEFLQYPSEHGSKREAGKPAEAISTTMKHVGVLVGALEPALVFYRDVLGFSETWRGSRDGVVLNWVNMKVPDGTDYVEFMLYRDLPEPTKRGTAHHMCLEVSDIEAAKATLAERATRSGYAQALEIRTGVNRKRQLNLYDPDGTRAELMEPRTVDGTPTPSATAPPPSRP